MRRRSGSGGGRSPQNKKGRGSIRDSWRKHKPFKPRITYAPRGTEYLEKALWAKNIRKIAKIEGMEKWVEKFEALKEEISAAESKRPVTKKIFGEIHAFEFLLYIEFMEATKHIPENKKQELKEKYGIISRIPSVALVSLTPKIVKKASDKELVSERLLRVRNKVIELEESGVKGEKEAAKIVKKFLDAPDITLDELFSNI